MIDRAGPLATQNDQPWGWKIVGRLPRMASRPPSPAVDEGRCTSSGCSASMMRRRSRSSVAMLREEFRLAIRGKRPTIFQPHGWSFCVASGPARSIITLSERLATRWTDLVVCVSEDERELATRYGLCGDRAISRSTRWTVVCNGVDTQRFRPPSEQEAATARDRLGLAAGAAVVCVGRIARQKGQDILLDAWPDVLRSVPDATLYVVGDGPDRAQLEAQGVPGVCFVGPWDDVRSWLW